MNKIVHCMTTILLLSLVAQMVLMLFKSLNIELISLIEWLCANRLSINLGETK